MFGFFTYPMKVTKALFALGWTPDTLPNSLDPTWGGLVRALRSNGVSVELAARMLDGALQRDRDCMEFINEKSGVYGMMFFGVPAHWDQGHTNDHPKSLK